MFGVLGAPPPLMGCMGISAESALCMYDSGGTPHELNLACMRARWRRNVLKFWHHSSSAGWPAWNRHVRGLIRCIFYVAHLLLLLLLGHLLGRATGWRVTRAAQSMAMAAVRTTGTLKGIYALTPANTLPCAIFTRAVCVCVYG